MLNRTKIVGTLGPSSDTKDVIRQMVLAGLSVARINFSHADRDLAIYLIETVRSVANELDTLVAIMGDIQGPKIRVGTIENGHVELVSGQSLTITAKEIEGNNEVISVTYPGLVRNVVEDDQILINDGVICLKCISKDDENLYCKVIRGGTLSNHKGINIPGNPMEYVPTVSEKDIEDIKLCLEQDIEYIALSFVRTAADVANLNRMIADKKSKTRVIVKVEKPQALDNLTEILNVTDGIMVARGDLGVEIAPEKLPSIQKRIISEANDRGLTVITATQMLESMIDNPLPTRAEVNDVANAVWDGSDAVMLSAETASGKHPVEAVHMMQKTIMEAELINHPQRDDLSIQRSDVGLGMANAVCALADDVGAKAIICLTLTGSMARYISKSRPSQTVVAIASDANELRSLAMRWGIRVCQVPELDTDAVEVALPFIEDELKKKAILKNEDIYIITVGLPFNSRSWTNTIRIEKVAPERQQVGRLELPD